MNTIIVYLEYITYVIGSDTYRFNQNKPSGASHTYVVNEFLTANCSCKTKYFWKNSYRRYASFAFKLLNYSRHIESLSNRKNSEIDDIFHRWERFGDFQTYLLQRLAVPRIFDQFGRERCQKKRKEVDYKRLKEFFQKYFVVHEQSAVKDSFITYVWPGRFILVESVCSDYYLCWKFCRTSMLGRQSKPLEAEISQWDLLPTRWWPISPKVSICDLLMGEI